MVGIWARGMAADSYVEPYTASDLGSACSDLVQLEENSQDPPMCRTSHKEYDLGNQSKPKFLHFEASVPFGKMK